MPPLTLGLLWATFVEMLKPASRTSTGAASSTLFDVKGYKGPIDIILHTAKATAGSTPTLTPTLVQCATVNGSPTALTHEWLDDHKDAWTVITDAADPNVLVAVIDPRETLGFVGFVGTIAGSNAAYPCSVMLAGIPAEYVPEA
jgi:hypothetical protein